mmetsp:Transcript_39947/g.105559  ORF Transcript_39947/g.105559 Transcript_39947/m.105559 type:complete len:190 (+) Transcript_39947:110-679(+)
MRYSIAQLVLLCLPLASAAPSVDAVHSLMEAAIERPKLPRLRIPGRGIGALVTPKNAAVLLPAVLGGMAIAVPDALAGLLVQLICFFGSLFEPFDSVLPERGLLRSMVNTVQRAKKAYNVKHGLVQIDEQQFFDEEDMEDALDDNDAADDEQAAGSGGASDAQDGTEKLDASGDDAEAEAGEEEDDPYE